MLERVDTPLVSYAIHNKSFYENFDRNDTENMKRYPATIFLFKVNNKNTWKKCEISSNITTKTPERHHWCCSGVFVANFEESSYLFLVLLLLLWTSKWLLDILEKLNYPQHYHLHTRYYSVYKWVFQNRKTNSHLPTYTKQYFLQWQKRWC